MTANPRAGASGRELAIHRSLIQAHLRSLAIPILFVNACCDLKRNFVLGVASIFSLNDVKHRGHARAVVDIIVRNILK
jgi:hypothetical protein